MELDRRKRESLVEARPPRLRQLHRLTPAEGAFCSMVHHVFWHFSKPQKGMPSPTFMKVKLKSISDRYKYIGEVPCFFVIPITYDNASSLLKESRGFMGLKGFLRGLRGFKGVLRGFKGF